MCLGVAWVALAALDFGPRSISLRLLLSGTVFTGAAIYVRRRWGGLALAGFFVVALVGLAITHGSAFAQQLDLFEYHLGVLAVFLSMTPSLGAVAVIAHLLARRSSSMLQRDLPISLAVFAVAQIIGVGFALAVALVTIPTVRT